MAMSAKLLRKILFFIAKILIGYGRAQHENRLVRGRKLNPMAGGTPRERTPEKPKETESPPSKEQEAEENIGAGEGPKGY